jgi:aspartyl-tRNA(Asn)/glutamyl-tRNA(Gln) amidotransferase subunit B
MPKNYQLTQYDKPSTANGYVEFEFSGVGSTNGLSRVRITRAHLEEDVGKSTYFERNSGLDFNRAGVPLMEIVSEPDLTSADMAYEYLNALKEILIQGGVSDCDMEKGMVRCDVNVSVRPAGAKELGAKIEIKNRNSFSGVRRALEYEIPRQIEAVRRGEKLIQSTRRWDDVAGITEQMRTKEDAHDYRYFPDPDLMPSAPDDAWLASVKSRVVELPLARKQRLAREFHITPYDAGVLAQNPALGNYFENQIHFAPAEKVANYGKPIANYIINNLPAFAQATGQQLEAFLPKLPPAGVFDVASAQIAGQISASAGQTVFEKMCETGKSPQVLIKELGLAQVSDTGAIEKFCDEAIAANPKSVADYQSGKVAALNSLKGQVMKLSKGKANPALVGDVLERKLKS